MLRKPHIALLILAVNLLIGCSKKDSTTMIDDKTFVFEGKVFQVHGNAVIELADLKSDSIPNINAKPIPHTFENIDLSYIKQGATATLSSTYSRNILYFKLIVRSIELRQHYTSGDFFLDFTGDDGFVLQRVKVPASELTRIVDANLYEYSGQVEMSVPTYKAVKSAEVSSNIRLLDSKNPFLQPSIN